MTSSLNKLIRSYGFTNVTEAAKAINRERSTLYRWNAKPSDRTNKLIPELCNATTLGCTVIGKLTRVKTNGS